jgi:hypothetical protein
MTQNTMNEAYPAFDRVLPYAKLSCETLLSVRVKIHVASGSALHVCSFKDVAVILVDGRAAECRKHSPAAMNLAPQAPPRTSSKQGQLSACSTSWSVDSFAVPEPCAPQLALHMCVHMSLACKIWHSFRSQDLSGPWRTKTYQRHRTTLSRYA